MPDRLHPYLPIYPGLPKIPGASPVGEPDGRTYERRYDFGRLNSQLARVYRFMADGQWRRLDEIAAEVGGSEAAVSARLRDLRKPKFGNHLVERRRAGDPERGVFEYRLVVR